jgi:hypothetical protein
MSKVAITGNASGTGTFTLAAPNSNSDRTLTLPDNTGTIITTASTFAGTGPAFSAYLQNNQSISNNTFTKVQISTEVFDTNNNFASNRFTPTVAGYYQFNGAINADPSSATTRIFASFYKNGSIYLQGADSTFNRGAATISRLIYLNGSGDYVELYAYITGTSPSLLAGETYTTFDGAMVRAA